METLRTWLTGVTAVAGMVFLVRVLAPKGILARVAEFIGGLLLILALLRPLAALGGAWELPDLKAQQAERAEELQTYKETVIAAAIAEYTSTMDAEEAE